MATRKYFVIGGRGYIGAALFAAIPDGVSAFATSSSFKSDGFLRLRLDMPQDFDDLPVADGDVVFLTSAISSPDICAHEYERAWAVNVVGTSALIDSVIARGGRVLFFSSDTVYGEREDEFDEHAPSKPAGEYAVMKHEVEQRFAGNRSFKAIRLSYVFAREDKFTRYLSGCAQRNEEAELFHPFFRSIIHRTDVVEGALALALRWSEFPQSVINFGGPNILSRIDFADCLKCVVFSGLRYRVTEPEESFFRNRPRIISMKSETLPLLLGRPVHTLREAAEIEIHQP